MTGLVIYAAAIALLLLVGVPLLNVWIARGDDCGCGEEDE